MSNHETCTGDACGYRRLYEGSQVSLADMSTRQGVALGRVGRLRAGIVTALRRNFPALAAQAEQQLGGRLADIDDEILLAYLEAFVNRAVTPADAGLLALKDALRQRGIVLSGDDPAHWASQVLASRGAAATGTPVSPAPNLGSLFAAAEGSPDPAAPAGRPALMSFGSAAASTLEPPEHRPEVSAATSAVDTPSGTRSDPAQPSDPPAAGPPIGDLFLDAVELWDGPLGAAVEADGRWSPSPLKPKGRTELAANTQDKPQSSPQKRERKRAPEGSDAVKAVTEDKIGREANSRQGTPRDSIARAAQPLETVQDERNLGPAVTAQTTGTGHASASTVGSVSAAAAAVPDDDDLPTPWPAEMRVITEPVRPQLAPTPTARPRRKPKQMRLHAEPAGEGAEEPSPVASPGPGEILDDGVKEALRAAVSIPRPVFVRDLVAVTGSQDVVTAWERECRADPANHPVRFIAPKARHRARGSLVFGDNSSAASASPDTWWGKCVATYRGALLYELGVLLHRLGDQIVSHRFEASGALLRLNSDKGLIGVVVALDTHLAGGEPGRAAVEAFLAELVNERLVLISVLTTSGEPGALDALVEAVTELAREHDWRPTAPVVAARSWEYADDRGSTAVMVLGG